MNRLFLAAVVSVAALAPAEAIAQRHRDERREQDVQSRIDTTFAFSRTGTIDLRQRAGDIHVRAWDRNDVRVQAFSERGRLNADLSSSRVTLEVEAVRGRTGDTRIELSVPVGVRVIARTASGDIAVTGTRGAVDANAMSGDVEVSDASGRISIETISGDVRGSRLSGEVRAESVNGSIELRDVEGDLRAESTSGDVTLLGVTSRGVYAATVSGDVDFAGTIDASGRYELHAHSGDIRLEIPEDARAQFHVETYTGSLDSEFPLTLQPGQRTTGRPRRFEFALGGGGGARVTAESFSGDIVLTRRSRSTR